MLNCKLSTAYRSVAEIPIYRNYLLVAVCLLLSSCANITPPSGGEKDTKSPALLSGIPPDKSINFHDNSIELIFDEWIKQNNLKQQLIITPYTENKYKISIKKNKLLLEFKEQFDSNTTYTFYFEQE